MKVIRFAAGLAVGYVLGSRAGREKYEQIVAAARKAQGHPAVTQAQHKAKELIGTAPEPLPASADPVRSDEPAPGSTVKPLPRPPRRPKTTPTAATANPPA